MSKAASLWLALFLLCMALPGPVESQAAVTITVSGTVTGPGGPVAGVAVYVSSDVEDREAWMKNLPPVIGKAFWPPLT